ncbi:LCP family glycopolymer transferase [Virgibacillus sp. FSP13]
MESRLKKKKMKKKRKWPFWIGGILIMIIVLIGGYLFYLFDKVGDTVAVMHDPLSRDEDPDRQRELESIFSHTKSVNILLLGVDERKNDKGRSDTMILLSLNPKTDSLLMLSIPRDTYVNIPGHGMDKINHAYAFGDVELSIKTVEEAFDIPVHYYTKVNMEGFKQGIDALDGVNVINDQAFSQGGATFSTGDIHLNGEKALKYIRMRKDDPRGDLGRNERQRSVITAAMNEAASFSSITKVGDILGILGNNVKTSLNMDQLQALFRDYRGTRKQIKTIEITGTGKRLDKWYYMVTEEEFDRITTEIQNHMDVKQ